MTPRFEPVERIEHRRRLRRHPAGQPPREIFAEDMAPRGLGIARERHHRRAPPRGIQPGGDRGGDRRLARAVGALDRQQERGHSPASVRCR